MRQATLDVADYEGLVRSTARRFAGRFVVLGLDEDDVRQIIWLKVIQARDSYSRQRSGMEERAYVFMCVANRVKDLKRDAANRVKRGVDCYIEDVASSSPHARQAPDPRDRFEAQYLSIREDEVFAVVDGRFDFPASLDPGERCVVALLALDYTQREVAAMLGLGSRAKVAAVLRAVAEKMADWSPTVGSAETAEREPVAA